MGSVRVDQHDQQESRLPQAPRRAAVSAWIGSSLEYYDFYIYGTAAALIFPKLFFSPSNPTAATIASLATFGVAYVARPAGALLMSHLGDTVGRKRVLLIALFGMGIATFLIGVLPTYQQVGIAAPILLLLLRVVQGLSVSGELSGASLTTLEHAPASRRGFFTSFALAGTITGSILATAVFIPVAAMSTPALLSWGWRVPFLLSAVVVVVGVVIRRKLPESPAFERERQLRAVPKAPLAMVFRDYPLDLLKVSGATLASVNNTVFGTFVLTYGVNGLHLPRTTLLLLLIVANIVAVVTNPVGGMLSDRFGRKPVFVTAVVGAALTIWPFFWALSQRNLVLTYVFGILLFGIVLSGSNGTWVALTSEQFNTRVRMSGMVVGTQFAFALIGFMPAAAAALAGPALRDWMPVAALTCAASVLAAIAALTMRETYKTPLRDLGKPGR